MTSSEFYFNILFVFFGIGRIDLCIFCSYECLEEIIGKGFRLIQGTFQVLIKFFSEGITVIDSEYSFKDIQVDCNVQILPGVVVGEFSNDFGDFLSFEEDSLRNACILNFFLCDEDGLVREVVVDLNRSDSIVFQSAFDNVLLEVCIVAKNLSIVFEPWRLYSGNVVIFRCFSLFHEGEIIDGGAHLVDQVLVDILFEELSFLLLRAIDEIELLCFMEILFIGIVEDMSWEEGNFLWNVGLHLLSYIFINNKQ